MPSAHDVEHAKVVMPLCASLFLSPAMQVICKYFTSYNGVFNVERQLLSHVKRMYTDITNIAKPSNFLDNIVLLLLHCTCIYEVGVHCRPLFLN